MLIKGRSNKRDYTAIMLLVTVAWLLVRLRLKLTGVSRDPAELNKAATRALGNQRAIINCTV